DGIRDFHVTGVQTCALPIAPGDRLMCVARLMFVSLMCAAPASFLLESARGAARLARTMLDARPMTPQRGAVRPAHRAAPSTARTGRGMGPHVRSVGAQAVAARCRG